VGVGLGMGKLVESSSGVSTSQADDRSLDEERFVFGSEEEGNLSGDETTTEEEVPLDMSSKASPLRVTLKKRSDKCCNSGKEDCCWSG